MDFTTLNNASIDQYLPTKSISELDIKTYQVTKVKKVNTRYGEKIVVELNQEFDLFLPKKQCEFLLEDARLCERMEEAANLYKLFLTYKGNGIIKFSNN